MAFKTGPEMYKSYRFVKDKFNKQFSENNASG